MTEEAPRDHKEEPCASVTHVGARLNVAMTQHTHLTALLPTPKQNGSTPQQRSSNTQAAAPVGFLDKIPRDAHIRDVAADHSKDWEQFQDYVAEVEQQAEVSAQRGQQDEFKERNAVEELENMEYVERYRRVLQRATGAAVEQSSSEANAGATSQADESSDKYVSELVRVAAQASKRRRVQVDDSDSDSDGFDPLDWRSKGN